MRRTATSEEKNSKSIKEEIQVLAKLLPVIAPESSLESVLENKIMFLDKVGRDLLNSKDPRKYLKTFFSYSMNGKAHIPPTARRVIQDFINKKYDIKTAREKWQETISIYEHFFTQTLIVPHWAHYPDEMPEPSAVFAPELVQDLMLAYLQRV